MMLACLLNALASLPILSFLVVANHSLNQLLHVPHIIKNLLSISKFALDNNVFLKFYSNVCYVKKQETKEILLQGSLKDGLYVFDDFVPLSQCSANTSSVQSLPQTFTLCHHHFGHEHANIIHRILKHCNVPHNINRNFCDSYVLGKMNLLPFSDYTTVSMHFFNLFILIFGVPHMCLLLMVLSTTLLF